MKKSLIALAVASVFIAPAALAQITVYGQVNVSIQSENNGAATSTTTTKVSDGVSRLGFRGTEDLGGDLSAFFQLETRIIADEPPAAASAEKLFGRTSHVGLRSKSMGTISLGNVNTPYKSASRRLDMFGDSPADTRNVFGEYHTIDITNAVMYASPAMGGLSVAVAKKFAEGTGSALPSNTSIAAMYDVKPFYATIAHSKTNFGKEKGANDPLRDSEGVQVGGGYTADAFAVSAVYERLTNTVIGTGVDTTSRNVALNAKYNISKVNTVKLGYLTKGDTTAGGVTAADGARQMAVGFDHSLSKRTTVGLVYTKVTNDAASRTRVNGGTVPTYGDDPSIIHLGIGHSF